MLSFIVPAHNEAPLLGTTLQSLHAAARAVDVAYEIVVVDDASDDDTARIAASLGARVLRVEHRHIAATRNAGARAAQGERLIFVDADTRVDAAVLAAALRALDAGAVGGGCAVRLAGQLHWHERLAIALVLPVFRWTKIAPGCFQFCTPAAFEAVGGYNERWFAAEDVALSRALAARGRFVILREAVWTSNRKQRTHGLGTHARLAWRFLRHGRRMLHSREHLGLWYGERRHGPGEE
jgi:glycosyltransferase involved in cell wall biosynthesis